MTQSDTFPGARKTPKANSELATERERSEQLKRDQQNVNGISVETLFERAVRDSFEPILNTYLENNPRAVIEQVKPVVHGWMDENFPGLLHKIVRAEIERLLNARIGGD